MTPPLRLGIVGLGRAFMLMLPAFRRHPGIRLAGAADPRREAREAFSGTFSAPAFDTVEELCKADVEALYIASPHQFHVDHTLTACRYGKSVLVEKPMALTPAECDRMIEAAHRAGVALLVGHSHSFDAPYLRTAGLVASGRFGALRMLTALNFTDFLYRPRRPEELHTPHGGGVVFGQAVHQIDVVRLIAGADVIAVRASAGQWDPARPTEGAYQAFLTFSNGTSAALTYSGYGHYDSDEMLGWIGEMGQPRDPAAYGTARAALARAGGAAAEVSLKNSRTFGLSAPTADPETVQPKHNHFGLVIASCERADLKPTPDGVAIYADAERMFEPLEPPAIPRREVLDELIAAVRGGQAPLHSGEWGRATLAVCLALLESARTGREIAIERS
jgi:phthalate 4,5-cis-dihydrodiol dehydrogenase